MDESKTRDPESTLGDDSSENVEALADTLPGEPDTTLVDPHAFRLEGEPKRGLGDDPAEPVDPNADTLPGEGPSGEYRRRMPEIPGYEILSELGRGGMAVVYRAVQNGLKRQVAIKMILAGEHASPESSVRFLGEAETVARLRHPNIVQIFHIGDHNGRPYFELELVDGGSLADQLDGTPKPPREAASLIESLARAIHEAHQQGIVHRDLKPANVLLTPDGTPKITDFGLAKSLSVESDLTRSETIMGSPSYMAPEQAAGRGKDAGRGADVYSLGAILYELVCGRPPFRAATLLETLEQVKTAEPVPPSRLLPGLPRDLDTICLKCLHKEPSMRYATAAGLADDLRRFLAGTPIVARRSSTIGRTWRWCRRNPLVAGLLAALVLVVAGGFSLVTALWRNAENLRMQAEWNLKQAESQRERADRLRTLADERRNEAGASSPQDPGRR
jgi:eukaryotic-like serine/threonine-protein kinase